MSGCGEWSVESGEWSVECKIGIAVAELINPSLKDFRHS